MLSESNVVFSVEPNVFQEKEDSDKEVTECLVIDNFLFNSISDRDPFWFTHVLLYFSAVEWKLDVSNILKLFVAFIKWVDKVFNFSHLELSYSQQGISWGDLVSET